MLTCIQQKHPQFVDVDYLRVLAIGLFEFLLPLNVVGHLLKAELDNVAAGAEWALPHNKDSTRVGA